MHSQITYNRSIWLEKDRIVTRFRKFHFCNFFHRIWKRQITPQPINGGTSGGCECARCWLLTNRHWPPVNTISVVVIAIIIVGRDLSLPTDSKVHSVFGPCISCWYERDLTLLYVGGDDWGPLSGSCRCGQDLTLMSFVGSNRGTLGGACQVNTPPSPCYPNPSRWF